MLEWTGERFLPWIKEPSLAYEHLHRYVYAAQFVKGKRVIDLASGEGYGSRMLAVTAESVVGVDLDKAAIKHASAKYPAANLKFLSGSVTKVPIAGNHTFDVAVCFETIEHVNDQEALLLEIKRLLTPDGVLIVSTPNKAVYDQERHEENEFHVKELSLDEFRDLLAKHFKNIRFLGQRIFANSAIWSTEASSHNDVREFVIAREGTGEFTFDSSNAREPMYYIALASESKTALNPSGSVLIDRSNELLKSKDETINDLHAAKESNLKALKWQGAQLAARDESIAALETSVAWQENQIENLAAGLEASNQGIEWLKEQLAGIKQALEWRTREVEELQEVRKSNEEGLAWRATQVEQLEREKAIFQNHVAELESALQKTSQHLYHTTEQLDAIHDSRSWKLILRMRRIRDRIRRLFG